MINKCHNVSAFKFENTEIIVELHKGNPVYGDRLCVYKKINPLKNKLIYDATQFSSNGLNGWEKYDEKISIFVNSLLDAIS